MRLFLAVLMGFLAVIQLSDVAESVLAVTTGPLNGTVAFIPYLIAALVLMTAMAFVVAAVSGRRR